jgi:hypothetical protein
MAAAGDPLDHYEVLGIRRTASAEEIRAAFRVQAKRYHPDRGGSAEDQARFRRLREAYETLRDPQKRVRYDALSLASGQRREGAGQAEPSDAGADADAGESDFAARARQLRAAAAATLRRLHGSARRARATAWLPLLAVLILGGLVWQRLGQQERAIAALGRQMEAASRVLAERERAVAAAVAAAAGSSKEAILFRAELVFPRGLAELGPAHRARADTAVRGLREAIAGLPPEDDAWSVLILGRARRVAEQAGGTAAAWELTVRRMGATSDYLVGHGVPAERITARLHAGPAPADDAPSVPEALQLRLLCCDADPG